MENIIRIYSKTEHPIQFLGFLWPIEPIVVPESFLTPVNRNEMLNRPQLMVEISKDGGETWEELKADEDRDAGRPPTSVPAPSAEALIGARKLGIYYTPPSKEAMDPQFDVLGMPLEPTAPAPKPKVLQDIKPIDPLEGICRDCGAHLPDDKRESKTHSEIGERCKKVRKKRGGKKTSQEFLAGGPDKNG